MDYNFDNLIDRRGSNSYKWDSRNDIPNDTIPLWVADMDFKAAPAIQRALESRVAMGVFGYTFVPDAYYQAVIDWFGRYHNWIISRDSIIYTSGVVPAIAAILQALTRPGEKILVQTPVYNCFFSSIRNAGCLALESRLILDGKRYYMDFEDLELKASDPNCHVMLLCNPHNPAGRVWSADELRRVAEICARHQVTVVSDEIHCELVYGTIGYTPFANVAVNNDWVGCISASKAFNIAGLQIANIIVPDRRMYSSIDRVININEVCDVNPFGVVATIAAYNESRDWLLALLPYIYNNYIMLRQRFETELPELTVIDLEGTYLAWVDCRAIGMPTHHLEEVLIAESHVWLNAGSMYGEAGEGFMRINLACQSSRLSQALDRLVPALRRLLDGKR